MAELKLPPNFSSLGFDEWVKKTRPNVIELTDREYARLCTLKGTNIKSFAGIPIRFLDGKQNVVD